MATIKEVRKAFEDELQAIFALDQHLSAERTAIKRKAFLKDRLLTDAEVAHRKEIAATRQELSEALRTLALETVDALEDASDVASLLAEINVVNQQLADDLARLKNMAEHADRATKVAAGLASVAEKLAGLANTIA